MSIHAIDAYLGAAYPDAEDLIRVPRGHGQALCREGHLVDHAYALSYAESIGAPILSAAWSAEYEKRLKEHRAWRDMPSWRVSAYAALIVIWNQIAIDRKNAQASTDACRDALETWGYWVILRDEMLYPRYEPIPAPKTDDAAYAGPIRDY